VKTLNLLLDKRYIVQALLYSWVRQAQRQRFRMVKTDRSDYCQVESASAKKHESHRHFLMTYKLNPEKRSWKMSRTEGRDTALELAVRKMLDAAEFRLRLPGKICLADRTSFYRSTRP